MSAPTPTSFRDRLAFFTQRVLVWGLPAVLIWIATRSSGQQQAWVTRFGFSAEALVAEPYRAWTAGLLHLSFQHALVNSAVWVMLCAFAHRAGVLGGVMTIMLFAWPASFALMWQLPNHHELVVLGLSGPLYALWAALSVMALTRHGLRWLAVVSLTVLFFKLWAEQPWLYPVINSQFWGFPVVQAVHANGALAGATMTFFALFVARLLSPSPASAPAVALEPELIQPEAAQLLIEDPIATVELPPTSTLAKAQPGWWERWGLVLPAFLRRSFRSLRFWKRRSRGSAALASSSSSPPQN